MFCVAVHGKITKEKTWLANETERIVSRIWYTSAKSSHQQEKLVWKMMRVCVRDATFLGDFFPPYIRLVYSRSFYIPAMSKTCVLRDCPLTDEMTWEMAHSSLLQLNRAGIWGFFLFIFSIFTWTSWISIDMDGTVCRERKTRTRISVLRYREYNNNISHGHANLVFSCYWNSCGGRSPSFACPLFPATIRSPFACVSVFTFT